MKSTLRMSECPRRWLVAGLLSFGAAFGTALVYVLWRRRSARPPVEPVVQVSPPRRLRPAEIDITEAAAAEAPPSPPPADPLEAVRGIGPKFAARLHAAGIHTFAALAAQAPERLREIVQAQRWQKVEPDAWIEEAARLARQAGE